MPVEVQLMAEAKNGREVGDPIAIKDYEPWIKDEPGRLKNCPWIHITDATKEQVEPYLEPDYYDFDVVEKAKNWEIRRKHRSKSKVGEAISTRMKNKIKGMCKANLGLRGEDIVSDTVKIKFAKGARSKAKIESEINDVIKESLRSNVFKCSIASEMISKNENCRVMNFAQFVSYMQDKRE